MAGARLAQDGEHARKGRRADAQRDQRVVDSGRLNSVVGAPRDSDEWSAAGSPGQCCARQAAAGRARSRACRRPRARRGPPPAPPSRARAGPRGRDGDGVALGHEGAIRDAVEGGLPAPRATHRASRSATVSARRVADGDSGRGVRRTPRRSQAAGPSGQRCPKPHAGAPGGAAPPRRCHTRRTSPHHRASEARMRARLAWDEKSRHRPCSSPAVEGNNSSWAPSSGVSPPPPRGAGRRRAAGMVERKRPASST